MDLDVDFSQISMVAMAEMWQIAFMPEISAWRAVESGARLLAVAAEKPAGGHRGLADGPKMAENAAFSTFFPRFSTFFHVFQGFPVTFSYASGLRP